MKNRFCAVLLLLLLVPTSQAVAKVIVCDPTDARCFEVEDLAKLVIPANHCVMIIEVNGKRTNTIACGSERNVEPYGSSDVKTLRLPSGVSELPPLPGNPAMIARPAEELPEHLGQGSLAQPQPPARLAPRALRSPETQRLERLRVPD